MNCPPYADYTLDYGKFLVTLHTLLYKVPLYTILLHHSVRSPSCSYPEYHCYITPLYSSHIAQLLIY